MTDKAQALRRKLKKLFEDSQMRDQILKEFNASTLDPVGPVGGDKGESYLKELNEMTDLEGKTGQKGISGE